MQIKIICPDCLKVINTIEANEYYKYITKLKNCCGTCNQVVYIEFCFKYPYTPQWCDSCDSRYICYSSFFKEESMLCEIVTSILEQPVSNSKVNKVISFLRKIKSTKLVIWE